MAGGFAGFRCVLCDFRRKPMFLARLPSGRPELRTIPELRCGFGVDGWVASLRYHLSMKLYVATSNPGKLRDFAFAASAFADVEILPLPNLGSIDAPEETADTFLGNATIKALAYSALLPGEIVIADDSGIVVPALGGEPGVRSARYAEDRGFTHPGTADERNLACLLGRAKGLGETPAFYTAVLAAARGGGVIATAAGRVDGVLLGIPRGTGGFGYDPIFYLPELGVTMAEIDAQTRLTVSHRGRALVGLLERLRPSEAKTEILSG